MRRYKLSILAIVVALSATNCFAECDMKWRVYIRNSMGVTTELRDGTRYFGSVMSSGTNFADALFTATIASDSAGIRPIGDGVPFSYAKHADESHAFISAKDIVFLGRGDRFRVGNEVYTVYVEADDAKVDVTGAASVADDATVRRLYRISTKALSEAAKCFLTLPYVERTWSAEFNDNTTFVQLRDGRGPRPRHLRVSNEDGTLVFDFQLAVWDPWSKRWQENREKLDVTWRIGGKDLTALIECEELFGRTRIDD